MQKLYSKTQKALVSWKDRNIKVSIFYVHHNQDVPLIKQCQVRLISILNLWGLIETFGTFKAQMGWIPI